MKTLRTTFLALIVATVSFSATQAFSQQEVDPDHFDQPTATKVAAPQHKASTHAHARTKMASKHSKQHSTRTTA